MQTVVDGILTNYEITGPKTSKKVLVLHGWGQDLKHWRQVSQLLMSKNQVICLDLPGFGLTLNSQTAFGVQNYANFVEKFCTKLKIEKPFLIGHSMGGKIAIELASRGFPVQKLILISPSGTNKASKYIRVKLFLIKIFKILLFWLPLGLKKYLVGLVGSTDYKNAGGLEETFKKFVADNVFDKARKIKVSTLIIWGENDRELSVTNAKKLKQNIKGSVLRILWGMGHSPNIQKPEELANLIKEYI